MVLMLTCIKNVGCNYRAYKLEINMKYGETDRIWSSQRTSSMTTRRMSRIPTTTSSIIHQPRSVNTYAVSSLWALDLEGGPVCPMTVRLNIADVKRWRTTTYDCNTWPATEADDWHTTVSTCDSNLIGLLRSACCHTAVKWQATAHQQH